MAWTDIPDEEIAGNKGVLSATAVKLRDNTDDHTHVGDVAALGTDSVGQSQILASSVGQGELKTATSEVSTTSSSAVTLTLAGGDYGHILRIKQVGGTGGFLFDGPALTSSSSYASLLSLRVNTTGTAYAMTRYIQASPPYNIGNGDIPLFMYALVNSSGEIESISTAPDPTWAYNGRNAIDPRRRYKKKGKQNYFYMKAQRPDKETDFAAWRESFENPELIFPIETEITQAVKNQDMDQIPHPFMGNDLTGKTIVLIDPASDLCGCLFEMHEEGEDVHDIIRNYLNVENSAIAGAVSPQGVMSVKARWK